MTDEQLIELLRNNQQAGFREAFALYGKNIYHTAYGFLDSKEEAEDIVQEVFIELFRSLHMFRGEAKLSTWMYRVVVNKSLELIRSKKRKKRWGFLLSITDPSFREKVHPESGEQADERMIRSEETKMIYDSIAGLPENQRIAFTLHKIDGMKHQQVAEIMDISVTAVESLIHRAKNNLKKTITNHYKARS